MPFRSRELGDPNLRMNESQRVTFRFARDTEVHYVDRLPSIGDRVTHQHELWIVASVDEDLVGVIVVCELLRPRTFRERSGSFRAWCNADSLWSRG